MRLVSVAIASIDGRPSELGSGTVRSAEECAGRLSAAIKLVGSLTCVVYDIDSIPIAALLTSRDSVLL
jgi:hypothetical protein